MLNIIFRNRLLFAGYFLILIICIVVLSNYGKKDTHLLLTGFHTLILDGIMRFMTLLGDGFFMVAIGLLLLFKKLRYGLVILSSFVITSLVVQGLKRLIFSDFKRPVAWFHDLGIEISRVPGVEYHSYFSFPSGHTTTAFALFFGLAFMVKNNFLKILFLILAAWIGFTRVYLSQHFLGDAMAGSLIGVFTVLLVQSQFEKIQSESMNKGITSFRRDRNE